VIGDWVKLLTCPLLPAPCFLPPIPQIHPKVYSGFPHHKVRLVPLLNELIFVVLSSTIVKEMNPDSLTMMQLKLTNNFVAFAVDREQCSICSSRFVANFC
jgi:hypothetical protein